MEQVNEFNLRDYWATFLKRKWEVIISTGIVLFATFIFTSFQTPQYLAIVTLKVDHTALSPTQFMFPGKEYFFGGQRDEFEIPDYIRQICSRPITEKTLVELGWLTDKVKGKEREDFISSFNGGIWGVPVENSNMIRINIGYEDPQKAVTFINKLAEVFIRENALQKSEQARNVRQFIEKALTDVSDKLRVQEERIRVLTTQGAVGSGVAIVERIAELEKKLSDLSGKFTDKHPNVISIKEEIALSRQQLKTLPKEEFEYGVLKRDVSVNEGLYSSLKQQLQEAQIKEAEKVSNLILVNPAVLPKGPFYPDKLKNYLIGLSLGLVLGVVLAFITEHLDTSIGRVDDIESFIKTSVIGIIPYCSEYYTQQRKRKYKRGFFSRKSSKTEEEIKPTHILEIERSTSNALFLEAFRLLSVNLQVLFGKGGRIQNKLIMITSCKPEEGKTLIISTLAVVMAQMGHRVLLIDSDIRRPRMHKIFGLKDKEKGLTDILRGDMTVDAAIRTATDIMLGASDIDKVINKPWLNNLNLLTAGSSLSNDLTLFNSSKLDEILNYYKNKYDVVLVDTSPILAVSEPSILLPKMDGVLLLYRSGYASRLALRRAKMQIESIRGKGSLSGVIINNVRPEVGVEVDYYYNKKYYSEDTKDQLGGKQG
ncbi:MAG: AAA family ATPase [Candidatus Omnitrophica bacterium]|nr:AAA family ATPase [Candidatus Omnitrophota bacterium]